MRCFFNQRKSMSAEILSWELQTIAIKDIKDHAKNPRQIGKDQFEKLGRLISKFGLIDKPILNQDLSLVGGHQRIKFMKKKKVKNVECWVASRQLEQEEIDELCIGLNLHQGTFDFDILANEWDPIDLLKYGFTEEQLVGQIKEAEEILDSQNPDKPKKCQMCPACGHEF